MLRSVRLLALPLALALLAPAPALAREPDGLVVTGWILGSGTNRLVERNAGGLSTLSVAGVSISADGGRVAAPTADMKRLARTAHRNDLTAELLVSNYSNRTEDFDPRALHRLLSSEVKIGLVAQRLAGYVADQGWDGVNVDLERVRRGDAGGLVRFVQAIQDGMDDAKTVTIDISAATSVAAYRDRGYRLDDLAAAADVIKLMTYDYSGPTWSRPGPIGPVTWQRDALDAILSVVPAEQVDLGVAGYGYSWPKQGTGRSLTIRHVHGMLNRDGATPHWRAGAGEWTAKLRNGTVLWWSDGRSYQKRVALAREYAVHGLAVWRIGSADTLR
jgi:spore germination protein YaaH